MLKVEVLPMLSFPTYSSLKSEVAVTCLPQATHSMTTQKCIQQIETGEESESVKFSVAKKVQAKENVAKIWTFSVRGGSTSFYSFWGVFFPIIRVMQIQLD